jgi:hypothetical protein
MWNLVSIHLETVVVSVQDSCTVCTKHQSESFWMHPMVLLGDEAQMDARFGLFGDCANLDARLVHHLRRMYHRLGNRFGRAPWYSSVTRLKWTLVLVYLD